MGRLYRADIDTRERMTSPIPIGRSGRAINQPRCETRSTYDSRLVTLYDMQSISLGQATAQRNFHSLDGLRGVAAICVVMLHYAPYIRPFSIGSGYLAVDLFFCLSGFVIAYAYRQRLMASITPGRFFTMRLIRIYPLYLLGTSIAIATPLIGLLLNVSRVWTWSSLSFSAVPAALMLPGPGQDRGWDLLYPMNYPAWSLLFELIANVAYAALLWTQARRLAVILVACAGLGCIVLVGITGNIDSGPGWDGLLGGLARVGFSFGVGVWIFRLYRDGRLPNIRIPPVLTMALVALVLAAAPPLWLRPYYDLACVLIVLPFCIVLGIINEPKAGTQFFAALGLISYPIYTIHLPASYLLSRFCDRLLQTPAASHAPWIGIGMLIALSAASLLLARYFDPAARALLNRWLLQRSQRPRA